MKKLFALLVLNVLSLPYLLMAQDSATYIDNLNVQDSSYMDQDLLADVESTPGSNTTAIVIIVAVVVVAAIVFFVIRKKKK
ncbi:MAG: LPXTG cell wall anchor domain-containing protein [Prolixibacteraceae bacterium]|nr:LPXTG cell wall anchor domain-containing protein [Prolixibacteraceae bacterium]